MGLDLVEFVMAVEEAFWLRIPDPDAEHLTTPGKLIDYLHRRLPADSPGFCMSQRAFYVLRRALIQKLGIAPTQLRPETDLLTIIPANGRQEIWRHIQEKVGAVKYWPWLARPHWLASPINPRLNRLGDIASFMVARNPWALFRREKGWTRRQVAEVVHGLIEDDLRIKRYGYTEDSKWSEDMGVY